MFPENEHNGTKQGLEEIIARGFDSNMEILKLNQEHSDYTNDIQVWNWLDEMDMLYDPGVGSTKIFLTVKELTEAIEDIPSYEKEALRLKLTDMSSEDKANYEYYNRLLRDLEIYGKYYLINIANERLSKIKQKYVTKEEPK